MGNGVDRDTTALETKLERAADEMIKENSQRHMEIKTC